MTFARSVGVDEKAFLGICWVCVDRLVSGLGTALDVFETILWTQAGSLVSASYTQAANRPAHRPQVGLSPEHLTFESRHDTQERNVRLRFIPSGSRAALGLFAPEVSAPFCTQPNCSRSQLRHPSGRSSHLTYCPSVEQASQSLILRSIEQRNHIWPDRVVGRVQGIWCTFLARQVAQADLAVSWRAPHKSRAL